METVNIDNYNLITFVVIVSLFRATDYLNAFLFSHDFHIPFTWTILFKRKPKNMATAKEQEAFQEPDNSKLVEENANPSAPPADMFEAPPGYENVTMSPFDQPPPPAYEQVDPNPAPTQQEPPNDKFFEPFTEMQVRSALTAYVNSKTFLRSKALERFIITDINMNSTFQVSFNIFKTLVTFEPLLVHVGNVYGETLDSLDARTISRPTDRRARARPFAKTMGRYLQSRRSFQSF